MSGGPRSVLVVRLSSIGDVVHTLPAWQALRSQWPEADIGWAVEEAAADLVSALPGVRVHLLPIQRWRRQLGAPRTWREIAAARRRLREIGYELAIDFQGLLKSAIVARASGAEVLGLSGGDAREPAAVRLYHRAAPELDGPTHAIDRAVHLARAAGASADRAAWPPLFDDAAAARVEARLREMGVDRFVALHAAANWPSKRYPSDRLVEAARRLHADTGDPVLWIWGPGEREEIADLAARAGTGNVPAFGTTLPELAALLQRARLFVGGDSAPLHLAVALGTPVVAIFGPTDPALLGPRRPEDVVVRRVLECSHCHSRRCPLGTLECLESISPDEIVAAAQERLRRAT